MTIDPRTPVLVGVAQTLRRPDQTNASEPVEQMADALRRAAQDSGAGAALLARADSIAVPKVVSWSYRDPGALVAERLGISPRETVYCTDGGNTPQRLVSDAAEAILTGRQDVVLLVGAEATFTRHLAKKAGHWLDWPKQSAGAPTRTVGEDLPGLSEHEARRGLSIPVSVYPLFENALRLAARTPTTQHRAAIAALWSRFSEVSASNPGAWTPGARSAEEIATPTDANRMVAWPYTKLLCANSSTDQAAAVIVCSAGTADALGVPRDRWVFPWSGADTHDHWYLSERADLHSSPALRIAGRTALALAGLDIDDPAYLDLYACFPSAVQVAAAELGLRLDDGRGLTVTGGNTFAGAPGNNYGMHAIVRLTQLLREDSGTRGLVTGVGWYLTKHAVGLYSATPPPAPFRRAVPQAEVDALPARKPGDRHAGAVRIESFTVILGRDGAPASGVVACLTPDGERAWGSTVDAALLDALTTGDLVGAQADLGADGVVRAA
jgi:acetyl-CoA C-acetyltransferase